MKNIHESVLVTSGNFERHFERRIEQAVLSIPFRIGGLLERTKTGILLTPTVVDYFPELANVQPRGWPKGLTWRQCDGLYNVDQRLAVIAQGLYDRKGSLDENSDEWLGIMFHELGHGVDSALEDFSTSPQFVHAYLADMAKLIGTKAEKELDYFTQGFDLKAGVSSAGLEEAMAESTAVLFGQASREKHAVLFCYYFKNSIEAVRKRLQSL